MAYQKYNGKYRWGAHDASQQHRMEQVLEVWLNNPLLPLGEIAEKANVDFSTLCDYRKNKEWMQTYKEECDRRFECLRAAAIEQLENEVLDGKAWAVKYVLDGLNYSGVEKIDLGANTTIKISIDENEGGDADADN